MMGKFMDLLMKSAAETYMPKLEKMAKARKNELEEVRAKVRTNPEEVEVWLDKEIAKLDNVDVKEMMKNATAGI